MDIERSHYPLLAVVCASLFCTPLMMAGINAVLPELGKSLNAGATQLSLIGTVYSLGLAVFQLACGSLGDIYGHRRLFVFGAAIFGCSGAILGFLHSSPIFVLFRFVQGAGGAILSATGLALLASCAPPEKRPVYLGFSGAAVYAGIACGPPVAGFIAETFGWRWLFWGNSLAILLVLLLMRHTVSHEWRPAKSQAFDWRGCLIYAAAMAALTLGVANMASHIIIGLIALSIFALFILVFAFRQSHVPFPMLNVRLLRENRVLALSSLAAYVNYASFFGLTFYFGIYAQVGKGLDMRQTGLVLAVQPLFQLLGTPLAARLCRLHPQGVIGAIGAGMCGVGLIAASFLRLDSPLVMLFLAQALPGCGISLFSLANTAIILESAGTAYIGQASALVGAVRTAGQLCGMALVTLTLGYFLGSRAVDFASMPGFMSSMRLDLAIFGVLNIMAIGFCLARNRRQTMKDI